MNADSYDASLLNRRRRSTAAEVEARRAALVEIVAEAAPCTVRQVFYAATVRNLVEKTEAAYQIVQKDLVLLRRRGVIPWNSLADSTRWMRKPDSFNSLADALADTAALYRRNIWRDLPTYAEVWLEKDALAGVLTPVTERYDVPLMVSRGYASLSFLHSAAEHLRATRKPAMIFHLGDLDPSGDDAARKIEATLRDFAPKVPIDFRRLAVTPEQVELLGLPTRPNKSTDTRTKRFGHAYSVELDAIPAPTLRAILEEELDQLVPAETLAVIEAAEQSERELLHHFARMAEAAR
jgi:hypothetical protein